MLHPLGGDTLRHGQTTTRMILEHRGYHCTSIRVITDFVSAYGGDDTVLPLASGTPPAIRLGSLTLPSRICFSTRASRDSRSSAYAINLAIAANLSPNNTNLWYCSEGEISYGASLEDRPDAGC